MNGSEPTLIPTPFSPREEDALRMIILTVGSLSLVVSMFVILTFLMFKEKRKYTASLNVMFVMSVAFTEFFLVIGAAMGFDSLRDPLTGDPSTYCVIQGVAFLFFGSCLVWFWFFITINLFMRMIMDKDLNNYNLVIAGIILSIIMTLPPSLMDEIGFEGAWCFIDSDATLLIYLDYYAAMGFCSIIGLFLWGAIMWKIYQSGKILSKYVSPLKSAEDVHIQASITEKKQLFFRQLAFVTVFEIMFVIFFASRVQVSINSTNDFSGWLFHTIMMSTMGLYTFFIFGVKRQNFELWGSVFKKRDTRLKSIDWTDYERIGD